MRKIILDVSDLQVQPARAEGKVSPLRAQLASYSFGGSKLLPPPVLLVVAALLAAVVIVRLIFLVASLVR